MIPRELTGQANFWWLCEASLPKDDLRTTFSSHVLLATSRQSLLSISSFPKVIRETSVLINSSPRPLQSSSKRITTSADSTPSPPWFPATTTGEATMTFTRSEESVTLSLKRDKIFCVANHMEDAVSLPAEDGSRSTSWLTPSDPRSTDTMYCTSGRTASIATFFPSSSSSSSSWDFLLVFLSIPASTESNTSSQTSISASSTKIRNNSLNLPEPARILEASSVFGCDEVSLFVPALNGGKACDPSDTDLKTPCISA
mmetsp:Transcript_15467/g.31956  ORF Transcript_15467/g.31956 Transcript_15467/m.31956 type:complete len:257 (+) Transcript_15467:5265-6035(+)